MKTKKEIVIGTIVDMVSDLLYYDRKEDEELQPYEIQALIATGETSVDEIVSTFKTELEKGLNN